MCSKGVGGGGEPGAPTSQFLSNRERGRYENHVIFYKMELHTDATKRRVGGMLDQVNNMVQSGGGSGALVAKYT